MNVRTVIAVTRTLHAPTLMVASSVPVMLVTQGMATHVKVQYILIQCYGIVWMCTWKTRSISNIKIIC